LKPGNVPTNPYSKCTRDAGLHGLLNFVGELRKVLMQLGEHFALVHVGREIADQFGLSGILPKFFD
jgi:hypothetical protein